MSGEFPDVPGFRPGDKVWPREGPMVLQYAPQTVLATCRHPVAGDWLWLDDGQCGFRSWAAAHWTTEEPGEAEMAARKERDASLRAEVQARYPHISGPRLPMSVIALPAAPPGVRRGSSCPDHGTPLFWLLDGRLVCEHGHGYKIPDPPAQAGKSRTRRLPRA